MSSNGVQLQCFVNLDQFDVIFWKINNILRHLTIKQYAKTHSLIIKDVALEVLF